MLLIVALPNIICRAFEFKEESQIIKQLQQDDENVWVFTFSPVEPD